MVHRITRDGEPPALDGVGEDHHGLIPNPVRLLEGLQDALDVVAAQVGQERGQFLVRVAIQQPRESLVIARLTAREALPYLAPASADEHLVLAVRHVVDAPPQRFAVFERERGLQALSVFEFHHVPAVQAELIANLLRLAVGHDAVQALSVQVHHPDDVAEMGHVFLRQRLPDVALVEFRVPHQGDEALRRARAEVIVDVGLHERGERGGHRGQPERAGGEIDGVFILRAAGIGLEAAEGAEIA